MSTDKEKNPVHEGQENEGHPATESRTTTNGEGETITAAGMSGEQAAEGEPVEKRKREYKGMEEEQAATRQKKTFISRIFWSSPQ
jgi:hypothetical protein